MPYILICYYEYTDKKRSAITLRLGISIQLLREVTERNNIVLGITEAMGNGMGRCKLQFIVD